MAIPARYPRLCAAPRVPGDRRRRDYDTFLEQVSVYHAELARDVTAGVLDSEEAVTRLIECGSSRRGAEARVDRWLGRGPETSSPGFIPGGTAFPGR